MVRNSDSVEGKGSPMVHVEILQGQVLGISCLQPSSSFDLRSKGNQEIVFPVQHGEYSQ